MSRLPFELVLALRYLRPKRTFVSVITLISILGVTLGVAVLIIVIAVMSGFDQQLRDKILGFNTHLKVFGQNHSLPDYTLVAATVRSNANVTGVTPFVMGKVLLETQPRPEQSAVDAPYIRGVDPTTEGSVSVLPKSIVRGEFDLEGRTVIMGSELANKLGLHVGDRVAIFSPEDLKQWRASQGKAVERAPTPRDFTVRGIFDVGYYDYNANVVVMSLENAQELYALTDEDQVHGLMVMIKDPDRANEVRKELMAALGPSVFLTIWTEENSAILGALAVEKNMMFYLLFFIMVVAALCIMSALITFVVQKTREIGMLKALGATNGQVAFLFLGQSAIVGVIGVFAGFGLGMLAVIYRNEFLHFMRRATQFELFPAEIYGFGELPALIMPGDIIVICSSALVICLLAGLLPAWNASRLQPVEALRHE